MQNQKKEVLTLEKALIQYYVSTGLNEYLAAQKVDALAVEYSEFEPNGTVDKGRKKKANYEKSWWVVSKEMVSRWQCGHAHTLGLTAL